MKHERIVQGLLNNNLQMSTISTLFRTEERLILLRAALSASTFTVQQIATRTGLSKGLVSPYLTLMKQEGLISRIDRTYQIKISALTVAIKRLLNVDLVSSVYKKPAWAYGIGMFGSWADGTNTDESDLDLWVFSGTLPSSIMIAELERHVSRSLSVQVHILILTREKIAAMKNSDEPFYRSFVKQSITLEGDSPEYA